VVFIRRCRLRCCSALASPSSSSLCAGLSSSLSSLSSSCTGLSLVLVVVHWPLPPSLLSLCAHLSLVLVVRWPLVFVVVVRSPPLVLVVVCCIPRCCALASPPVLVVVVRSPLPRPRALASRLRCHRTLTPLILVVVCCISSSPCAGLSPLLLPCTHLSLVLVVVRCRVFGAGLPSSVLIRTYAQPPGPLVCVRRPLVCV